MMLKIDGFSVLASIRSDPALAQTRVRQPLDGRTTAPASGLFFFSILWSTIA
ncbi:hypothetical protein [Allochromatium vinosum]|uniref:hypothetical protein n=1 Tax=Allochromatium vinosum TaxID=1049 RepID=UPI00167F90E3|nr:hypothetical protein [Allochromatium vinosum]